MPSQALQSCTKIRGPINHLLSNAKISLNAAHNNITTLTWIQSLGNRDSQSQTEILLPQCLDPEAS